MDKSILIQKQIKDNAEDLHNYIRELKLWEEEMKRKDKQLSNEPTEETLPPVRRPKLTTKSSVKKQDKTDSTKKKKLTSYDYSSWDKFDVDKACEEIDNEDNKNKDNEVDSEELTEQEEKYLKEKALYEKELGNKHVKANKWDEAIECYSRAIEAYPRDPVFFANRALCQLKKKNYEEVESDCTASLKLDATYVKAMLRRAAAREALDRLEDAAYDLRNALKLEPNNGQALRDLARLTEMNNKKKTAAVSTVATSCKTSKESSQKMTSASENLKAVSLQSSVGSKTIEQLSAEKSRSEPEWEPCSNTIQPINKPPHLRSKKNLKRVEIYDIGPNTPTHICARKKKDAQNVLNSRDAAPLVTANREEVVVPPGPTVKQRSILTMTSPVVDVPPPPTTSVQFHTAWSSVKAHPYSRYRYLKQVAGASLPEIFKESLESGVFSSIVDTLATEFTAADEPVLGYLHGLSRVRRFSTLALFMSSTDKSNLMKLFDHCLRKKECSPEEINELQRLYEIS